MIRFRDFGVIAANWISWISQDGILIMSGMNELYLVSSLL